MQIKYPALSLEWKQMEFIWLRHLLKLMHIYTQVIKKVYSITCTCIFKFLRLLLSKTMVSNNQTNVSEMLLKIPTCGLAVDGLADVEFAEFLNSMWDGLLWCLFTLTGLMTSRIMSPGRDIRTTFFWKNYYLTRIEPILWLPYKLMIAMHERVWIFFWLKIHFHALLN